MHSDYIIVNNIEQNENKIYTNSCKNLMKFLQTVIMLFVGNIIILLKKYSASN